MTKELFRNGKIKVFSLQEKNKTPELEPFIKEVYKSDPREISKLQKFFVRFGENPDAVFHTEQKYKKLNEHIHEFKPTSQIRLYFFYDKDKSICITHGYIKKTMKDSRSQAEIEKATAIRNLYFKNNYEK